MTTLVYLRDENGKIYCEQPYLTIGQAQKFNAEIYMNKMNKHLRDGFKYKEVVFVEETENFYSCRSQLKHIKMMVERLSRI